MSGWTPKRMCLPIAVSDGKSWRSIALSMITTCGCFSSSVVAKSRPETKGMPSVLKKPGETAMRATVTASAAFLLNELSGCSRYPRHWRAFEHRSRASSHLASLEVRSKSSSQIRRHSQNIPIPISAACKLCCHTNSPFAGAGRFLRIVAAHTAPHVASRFRVRCEQSRDARNQYPQRGLQGPRLRPGTHHSGRTACESHSRGDRGGICRSASCSRLWIGNQHAVGRQPTRSSGQGAELGEQNTYAGILCGAWPTNSRRPHLLFPGHTRFPARCHCE
jgi:hypothetical protein